MSKKLEEVVVETAETAAEVTAEEAAVVAAEDVAAEESGSKKTSKKAAVKENADAADAEVVADTAEDFEAEADIADDEAEDADLNGEAEAAKPEAKPAAAKKPRKRAAKKPKDEIAVVTIDGERTVLTDEDKYRADLLDIVESKKVNKILTDTITGVEKHGDMTCAVLHHGAIKVIIPVELLIPLEEGMEGEKGLDIGHHAIRRLGAEVDYVVEQIDEREGMAVGNRIKAMSVKQKRYYFGFDKNGNKILYPDAFCEARIVSVTRTGVFAEIFGVETFIRFNELSYKRLASAEDEFSAGMRVLVKILDIKTEGQKVKVEASIKRAQHNPFEEALKKYSVGNLYTGKVTVVDENGVFVSLDGGSDCLCKFPDRGRPSRGARATVRILGIDSEHNKIWGVITHMNNAR